MTQLNLKLTLTQFLIFETAESAARLDDAATNPSTHYNSPVYSKHPHGYIFFVQFYLYDLDSAAGNHASITFALFPGDYDDLLAWPFPKTIHLSESVINLTPKISGLSPSQPPTRYFFEGLPENHVLP